MPIGGAAPSGGEFSIVITIPEDPPSFNGLVTDAGFDSLVMELVLQSVTDIDPQGNIFPELAAGLPTLENGGVVIDEDTGAMDVTWTLRDDVRWADGEPLTAADVLFTWEAISDPEGGSGSRARTTSTASSRSMTPRSSCTTPRSSRATSRSSAATRW